MRKLTVAVIAILFQAPILQAQPIDLHELSARIEREHAAIGAARYRVGTVSDSDPPRARYNAESASEYQDHVTRPYEQKLAERLKHEKLALARSEQAYKTTLSSVHEVRGFSVTYKSIEYKPILADVVIDFAGKLDPELIFLEKNHPIDEPRGGFGSRDPATIYEGYNVSISIFGDWYYTKTAYEPRVPWPRITLRTDGVSCDSDCIDALRRARVTLYVQLSGDPYDSNACTTVCQGSATTLYGAWFNIVRFEIVKVVIE